MSKQKKNQARRLARLAAVQALYQIELLDKPSLAVINEFISHHFIYETENLSLHGADTEFFKFLVKNSSERLVDIDRIVESVLTKNQPYSRISLVLKSILRLGCLELIHDNEPPIAVIINEYVEISKGFYDNREVAFVNGSLDAIAKTVRTT
jgi:N utilization substance protein B